MTHPPIIALNDLSHIYPDGRRALQGVHLAVGDGERVALVGPNGAGKSTLLLHLNGTLRAPHAEQVCVGGVPLDNRTVKHARARVGLVFQDPDDQLFSSTVFEDVAFGPLHLGYDAATIRERVAWALAAVGMGGYEERPPYRLSLGEKKRVAIATVLAMQPDVLVLDEPSAGLDPRARRNLIALLATLPQTLLLATHDMRLVWALCPRTVILDQGRIVADGPTTTLLRDQMLMEQHGLETPPEALLA